MSGGFRFVGFLALGGVRACATAARYGSLTRCSRQTATGDIDQLIKLGILAGNQAGGWSTSYSAEAPLPWDDA